MDKIASKSHITASDVLKGQPAADSAGRYCMWQEFLLLNQLQVLVRVILQIRADTAAPSPTAVQDGGNESDNSGPKSFLAGKQETGRASVY